MEGHTFGLAELLGFFQGQKVSNYYIKSRLFEETVSLVCVKM